MKISRKGVALLLIAALYCQVQAKTPFAVVYSETDKPEIIEKLITQDTSESFAKETQFHVLNIEGNQILVSESVLPLNRLVAVKEFYLFAANNTTVTPKDSKLFDMCKDYALLVLSPSGDGRVLSDPNIAISISARVNYSLSTEDKEIKLQHSGNVHGDKDGQEPIPYNPDLKQPESSGNYYLNHYEAEVHQQSIRYSAKFANPKKRLEWNNILSNFITETYESASQETRAASITYKNLILSKVFPESGFAISNGTEFDQLNAKDQRKFLNSGSLKPDRLGFASSSESALFFAKNPKISSLDFRPMISISFISSTGQKEIYSFQIDFFDNP